MNTLKNLGLAVFLMTAAACGNGSESNTEETPTATNVKDTVNAYVCPMRCENSGSSQAGACPVCAMDLVQNTDFLAATLLMLKEKFQAPVIQLQLMQTVLLQKRNSGISYPVLFKNQKSPVKNHRAF